MKNITTRFLLFFFLYSLNVQAQLTVSTAMTDSMMVKGVFVGTGVYARNIQYTGANGARGTFSCTGGCNLGITSGIMLTSGSVSNAIGPNNSAGQGTDNGAPGDATLNALGATTFNASVLEFDFMVATDSVEFKFVFGSEEYSDFVNTGCNDIFGFFITGPNFNNTNIALIPGTTTPVTIDNVNNGPSPGGVPPNGPCMNCAYWRDNTGDVFLQYDGFTTVLTAAARVRPCEIYHLKLAIADQCDGVYDSGVFLEGNSFNALGEIPLYVNGSIGNSPVDTVYICPGDSVLLSMPECHNYNWSTGDTVQSIWVDTVGSYVAYTFNGVDCFAFTSQASVQWAPNTAIITPSGTTNLCAGDSVTLTSNIGNAYLWSTGDTTRSITVLTAGNYIVTVDNGGNCIAISSPVQVTVTGLTVNITTSGPTTFCQGGTVTLTADPAPNYLWSNGAVTQSISAIASGSYTVTVSSAGCSSTTTQTVTVNSNPVPVITGNPAGCAGLADTLYAPPGFISYLWSGGQTSIINIVNTSGTYTTTVTDNNGCTGSASIVVNMLPFTPPIIAAPTSFCAGTQAQLDAGAGYSNYVWSNGASGQQINTSSGGPFTVTVTAANGCTGTASATIILNALPNPAINGMTAFCQNDSAALTAASPGLNYLWSTGNITSSLWVNQAGTYTLTVTDANSCSASSNHTVSVNALPLVQITGDFIVCQGDPGDFNAGSGFSNYLWSNGGVTAQIAPLVSGTYTVTVTDANGCQNTDNEILTVNSLPTPTLSGTLSFCSGTSTTLQSVTSYASYAWSDGTTGNSIVVNAPGSYTLTVTDANSCIGSETTQVNMNPLPQPVLATSVAVCSGDSIQLTPGVFNSYQWSDGSVLPGLWTGSAGNYTVTVTDNNGCINSTSGSVAINSLPTPLITGPTAICSGETAVLNASAAYSQYQWSNGGTGITTQVLYDGTYTVTVTDANGCKGSDDYYLKVNPLPLISISGDHDFCDGASTTLITTSGQGTYLWSDGSTGNSIFVSTSDNYKVTVTTPEGCSLTDAYLVTVHPNPVVAFSADAIISCTEVSIKFNNQSQYDPGSVFLWTFGDGTSSASDQPIHAYPTTGSFLATLLITTPYGCQDSDTSTITTSTPLPPIASFIPSSRVVSVFNSEISFTNTSKNATRYKWSFDDNTSSEDENPVHRFVNVGEIKVSLKAWNGVECYDETEMTLQIVPLFIPNGFTPNDDGKNDVFFDGTPVLNSLSYDMRIFDRWGKLIYQSASQLQPWDGFVDGQQASEGVYTYLIRIVTLDGKPYEYRGTFSLLR